VPTQRLDLADGRVVVRRNFNQIHYGGFHRSTLASFTAASKTAMPHRSRVERTCEAVHGRLIRVVS
jgi:hypothetical protein